ncbi:MAG: VWA domain-containing protein [Candidatus Scalindua sp. AMX11]|nr:MAG: VWA domain-containing protein [Candidatus Scalindua sp.]NOG82770.1 VWA domain-containing protein [Planctomycetota bacterium]RZV95336.1 MAG: VWA domain-containing protein [Candidatus Scalindua sp. SCAELEC01]TDE66312.1 MAG: VWA domain-containing protein [Candidatus Scalindua sp. AMX11]GJQ57798.1 MAG: serine/threonine protein kinase [Candidatus Scalindua sp.]
MIIRTVFFVSTIVFLTHTLAFSLLAQEKREPVRIEGKQVLPLVVLTRPFSNVYREKDTGNGTVMENIPSFQPFYVYTKPEPEDIEIQDAWYEVGTDVLGSVVGWMRYDDVFEWKQAMCLAFTHSEGRKPVLMFEKREELKGIIDSSTAERVTSAKELYSIIDSKNIPKGFPVVSVEPKKYISIAEQFYLLPILDFEIIEVGGREGRLIKLAAVTSRGPNAREKCDIRVNRDYLNESARSSTEIEPDLLRQLSADIVWVMDTTMSMQSHIAKTLEVVREVSTQITQDKRCVESIRFGIWGYRDSVDNIPAIGYTTRNYTPELQTIHSFKNTLEGVKATTVDSVDYEEDMFSGINDAINKTKWTNNALRFIILVGDAPSHESGHKWNGSNQTEGILRTLADNRSIYIYAIHIKVPKAERYYGQAETQFGTLSRNRGQSGKSAYYDVSSDDMEIFNQVTSEIALKISKLIYGAKQGTIPYDKEQHIAVSTRAAETVTNSEKAFLEDTKTKTSSGELSDMVIKAALVEWIGKMSKAESPRDIVAWAVDKDLVEPSIQSMEVCLLIKKRQLDTLKTALSNVLVAGRLGQMDDDKFFNTLQGITASAARDPDKINHAKFIAQTGLIPEFILGLPYMSRLMDITNELWSGWSADEQDQFLSYIFERIEVYATIHDTPDGWIQLNNSDDPDDYVYPLSLELLP